MRADLAPGRRPRILLLQGPNMNWLGKRQPELYGQTSALELDEICRAHARRTGYDLEIFYTNSEGAALDQIYALLERDALDGLVMNPAAWSIGGGSSLRFCLMSIDRPYIEVHIRNQYKMHNVSTLADLADGVIQGLGVDSYFLALDGMFRLLNARQTA
ncbi:type II 3-dehydroquinate dehydratase [Defluviimonas sp. WL0075]|uniref:3-dehydroquinate dehydratase n=1 Tax=Albidovulum sediminicola TaxID=2984331 RepID=A0ABT2Z6W3_9RHOB|nr:type II 3-dehydroquinate dehydratase [Defluviimonas sp. WL0075]MCV2866874.1 type II 3-dehydroquinate dehydratase [Defluviimonas sp. WL0075]